MMKKEAILAELRRTAAENGGAALGRQRFEAETGIKRHHIFKYWPRYGDALCEAGFSPNEFQRAYDETDLLQRVAELARELGHFPTRAEMSVKHTCDSAFPGKGPCERYRKAELVAKVRTYCAPAESHHGIVELCDAIAIDEKADPTGQVTLPDQDRWSARHRGVLA
jgi:hypothetical protein